MSDVERGASARLAAGGALQRARLVQGPDLLGGKDAVEDHHLVQGALEEPGLAVAPAAGQAPRFKPGNIVFSYRSCDVIGVIDRPSGEILWAWGPGVLDGQHKPHMLPNGNLLIFDNGTLRGYSRVIELNPLTEEIEWEYTATPREDFFSGYISGAQRLPNGNTLICEGGKAHLFEVTPEGEIVWDFRYPWHEEGGLGSIYRCLRYSPEYVQPLLERIGRT